MKCISSQDSRHPIMDKALHVILNHGVILIPTSLGYALITDLSKEGVEKIKSIEKQKDKDQRCNVIVSDEAYKQIFDCRPLNLGSVGHITDDLSLTFVRRHSNTIKKDLLQNLLEVNAINSKRECEVSINLGPICDELLRGLESKKRYGILMGINCISELNTKDYHLDHLDSDYKVHADVIIDIPHWSKPQLDEMGRWLSSPVFDLEELRFCRGGKNLSIAAVFVSVYTLTLFTKLYSGGSASISWKEFQSYYSKFENMGRDQMTDMKLQAVFKTIDKDGSGSLDVNEMYEYVLNSAHGSNAVVFGGDSSTVLMLAPPPHKKNQVKFHLEPDLMPTPIKVEQRDTRIIREKESHVENKKVSQQRSRSPSPENFKRVFHYLCEQSQSRQEDGKARRHIAECLSKKRAAQRKGEKYICDNFCYHTLIDSIDDEVLPYANVTSTEAEELYEKWIQCIKSTDHKNLDPRKMSLSRVRNTKRSSHIHNRNDRGKSVPYDLGGVDSHITVTKTISTSSSSLSE